MDGRAKGRERGRVRSREWQSGKVKGEKIGKGEEREGM